MRGAPPGRVVRMRVSHGEIPSFGDVLELASGKRYQVVEQRGRQLRALVLKPDDVIERGTAMWSWAWDSRKKRGS